MTLVAQGLIAFIIYSFLLYSGIAGENYAAVCWYHIARLSLAPAES